MLRSSRGTGIRTGSRRGGISCTELSMGDDRSCRPLDMNVPLQSPSFVNISACTKVSLKRAGAKSGPPPQVPLAGPRPWLIQRLYAAISHVSRVDLYPLPSLAECGNNPICDLRNQLSSGALKMGHLYGQMGVSAMAWVKKSSGLHR